MQTEKEALININGLEAMYIALDIANWYEKREDIIKSIKEKIKILEEAKNGFDKIRPSRNEM